MLNQIGQPAKDVDQRSTKTHFDWLLWFNHPISMEKSLIPIISPRKSPDFSFRFQPGIIRIVFSKRSNLPMPKSSKVSKIFVGMIKKKFVKKSMENHQPMIQVNLLIKSIFPIDILLDGKSDTTSDDSKSFSVEYARSNRSTCHGCKTRIDKDLVRLSKKTNADLGHASTDQWYHIDCFKEHQDDLLFQGTAETFVDFSWLFIRTFGYFRLTGFNDLNKEDQTELKKKFGSATVNRKRKNDKTASSATDNADAPKAKQSKIEEDNQSTSEQDQTRQKKEQSELLWKYKDALKREVPNDVLKELLEHNQQKIATGESNV